MASLETILGKGVQSNGRSMGGVLKTNEPTGLIAAAAKSNTKFKTAAQVEAEAAAARTATNEGILAELGIDAIIGSKRKKNKRYNAATGLVEGDVLGG